MNLSDIFSIGTFGIVIIMFFIMWFIMNRIDKKNNMITNMQRELNTRLEMIDKNINEEDVKEEMMELPPKLDEDVPEEREKGFLE